MLAFAIITKRPEGMSFDLYKKYLKYQKRVIRRYLGKGGGGSAVAGSGFDKYTSHEYAFLVRHSPRKHINDIPKRNTKPVNKKIEHSPANTQGAAMIAEYSKNKRLNTMKIAAWIIIAVIAVSILAYHLW